MSLVENHHAMVVQAVGDENPAVRQKRDVLRLGEVRAVAARHVLLAERLQQLAAVIGEDVDLMEGFVDTHTRRSGSYGLMRTRCGPGPDDPSHRRVPLRPALLHLAVRVERVEAVPPDAADRWR